MLKRLWRWVWGEPDPDTTLELLRIIVENQERSQTSMMSAVTATIAASEKQAEVLSKYLNLFQNTAEPQSWKEDTPEEESAKSMKAMGFDPDASEAAQAEWVLANLGRM